MQEVTLAASTERATGSGAARRLRAEGRVPAVVYGNGGPAQQLTVDGRALRSVLSGGGGSHALVNLRYDGIERLAIVKELQRDPVRLTVDHVDFLEVDPTAEVEVEVAIVLHGTAEQVRRAGGVVEQVHNYAMVTTTPRNIPQELTVDVSGMEIDQMLHVSDLDVPSGARIDLDPEEPIAVAKKSRRVKALEREAEAAELAEEFGEGLEGAEGDGGEGGASGEGDEAPAETE